MNLNNDLTRMNELFKNYKEAISNDARAKVDKLGIYCNTTQEIDIDSINEQLGKGNKEVLSELEKLGISYTLAERDNGFTVKFSYKGTNYTIAYFEPDGTAKPDNSETTNTPPAAEENEEVKPETPETSETTETSETQPSVIPEENEEEPAVDAKYEWFDYSVVKDLDTPVSELFDDNTVKDKSLISIAPERNINAGGYDALLTELTNIKPQLKNYIKTELEATGKTYDDSIVDKYLNMFISQALNEVLNADIMMIGKDEKPIPENPSVQDIINMVIEKVDEELAGPSVFEKALMVDSNPFGKYDIVTYEYVLNTADCLLTDEERRMKSAITMADSGLGGVTENKGEVSEWIDTYAIRMKAILKHRNDQSIFTDSQIESIINQTKSNILENAKPDKYGFYDTGAILKEFKEQCEKLETELIIKHHNENQ